MAFTVEEFRDLLRILEEQPEWRAELRRLILTDELLTLPQLMRALVEAQQRTEERLATLTEAQQRTEERLATLTEAQQRTEERVAMIEERMDALIAVQQRTDERLEALVDALQALTLRVDSLTRSVSNLHDDASKLKGYALENRYRSHAQAYFAPVLCRIRIIGGEELETLMERAVEQGQLSESEALDMVLADVVARGRRRDDNTEVYLVVEVPWRVDPYDVERAVRRSSLLSRTGTPAFAVVAGETVIEEAANLADRLHVWQVTDGHVVAPPDGSPQHPC
jgi:multidrug efflux pump subunit AcrA (membrane-fusion protein)